MGREVLLLVEGERLPEDCEVVVVVSGFSRGPWQVAGVAEVNIEVEVGAGVSVVVWLEGFSHLTSDLTTFWFGLALALDFDFGFGLDFDFSAELSGRLASSLVLLDASGWGPGSSLESRSRVAAFLASLWLPLGPRLPCFCLDFLFFLPFLRWFLLLAGAQCVKRPTKAKIIKNWLRIEFLGL